MKWYLKVLRQYADFNGRARRTEFWMFTLFSFIFSMLLSVVDIFLSFGTIDYAGFLDLLLPENSSLLTLSTLYYFLVLIPSIAVSVRRLHDVGKSGWFLLVPITSIFISLFLTLFIFGSVHSNVPESISVLVFVIGTLASYGACIWLLVLFLKDSQPVENKYGPNPKETKKLEDMFIQKL